MCVLAQQVSCAPKILCHTQNWTIPHVPERIRVHDGTESRRERRHAGACSSFLLSVLEGRGKQRGKARSVTLAAKGCSQSAHVLPISTRCVCRQSYYKYHYRCVCLFAYPTMVTLPQHSPSPSEHSLDVDDNKKQKGPSSRSYKLPVMVLCAVLGYGLCQLDLSAGTLPSMPAMRGFTTTSYLNNGNSNTNAKKPILQISILGERNSGTRWTWG